jgi:hypothetical protein
MRTPPTFVIYRIGTASVTVLVLLLFGLGLGGWGPLHGLSAFSSHAVDWLQARAGVTFR